MNTPRDTLDCGHSLAELSAYLDTGQIADPAHLDSCPECQAGLASLRNLSALGSDLLRSDVADAGSGNDDWMQSILDNLQLELRPGRSIPCSLTIRMTPCGRPRDPSRHSSVPWLTACQAQLPASADCMATSPLLAPGSAWR